MRANLRVGRFIQRLTQQAMLELLQLRVARATKRHDGDRRHFEMCRLLESGQELLFVCLHKCEIRCCPKARNPRLPRQSWVLRNCPGWLESLLHDAEGAVGAPEGHVCLT